MTSQHYLHQILYAIFSFQVYIARKFGYFELSQLGGLISWFMSKHIHYRKIDKYKRKYQVNIFLDKFLTDFTDGNILSVYTEGITVEKNLNKVKK